MKTINDEIDFLSFLGNQESQFVIPASETKEGVLSRLRGDQDTLGDLLPWNKTHNDIRLRMGEVSIWGGYNGHGKSQILGQVFAWLLFQAKCLIASMEMKPDATMYRMVRQISGLMNVNENYANQFLNFTDDKLWIYDQKDTVDSQRILGMVHYAAQELGIKHIMIDSLMKCGFKGSTDAQSMQQVEFVDRLCWAAKSNDVHIHLVHHMRKGEGGEFREPDKHDFRGAGQIVDLVDNAFIVHRNKGKEQRAELGEDVDHSEPDATLKAVKQRHGEWEGKFLLWFHKESLQYTPHKDNRALTYDFQQRRAG